MKPIFICRFAVHGVCPVANPPGLTFHPAVLCLVLALFGAGFSCRADIFFPAQDGIGGNVTNILTPVPNSGILRIDYDFYTIPDQLDVYYDGTDLFSSGMVAGTGHFDIPYGPGISDSLSIVIDKDGATDPNTAWQYTPSIAPVPEPGAIALFAVGLVALGFAARVRPFARLWSGMLDPIRSIPGGRRSAHLIER